MKSAVYVVGIFTVILIVATLLTQTRIETVSASDAEFVDASKCKLCHNKPNEGQQYATWEKMPHAHAFELLKSDAALSLGKEKGLADIPSKSAECLKCHVTGYNAETKAHPNGLTLESGVQCGSCHGPGSLHLEDGKALRMNKDAGIDVAANLAAISAETCAQCHNEASPTWDPARYTLESGETTGFDFEQASKKIDHTNPNKTE